MDKLINNSIELKSDLLRQNALNKISVNIDELKNNVGETDINHYIPSDGDIKLIADSIDIGLKDLTPEKRKKIYKMDLAGSGDGNGSGAKDPRAIATGELPSAKFLYQEIYGSISDDVYNRFCEEVAASETFIAAGRGVEYSLEQHNEVSKLIESEFIPSARKDIDNYMFWDNIILPGNDMIFKSTISISP